MYEVRSFYKRKKPIMAYDCSSKYLSDACVRFLFPIANSGKSHQAKPETLHESPRTVASTFFFSKINQTEMEMENKILFYFYKFVVELIHFLFCIPLPSQC